MKIGFQIGFLGMMYWLTSCASGDIAATQGSATPLKIEAVGHLEGSQLTEFKPTQPKWVISSTDLKVASEGKGIRPEGKPSGPFSVLYTLEGWAEDDHRLVLTLRSNRAIDEWTISLPQLEKATDARIVQSAKPQSSGPNEHRKRFDLGALPSLDRLLVTVQAKILGQTASKTIAIPLRRLAEKKVRVCDKAAKDCFHVVSMGSAS
jgi:hypothetical protein